MSHGSRRLAYSPNGYGLAPTEWDGLREKYWTGFSNGSTFGIDLADTPNLGAGWPVEPTTAPPFSMSAVVKGFGCRPSTEVTWLRGRRPKASREGTRGIGIAVDGLWGFDVVASRSWSAAMRWTDVHDRVEGHARLARTTKVAVWPLQGG